MGNAPIVLVFAGPNGSGKSTVTKDLILLVNILMPMKSKKKKIVATWRLLSLQQLFAKMQSVI